MAKKCKATKAKKMYWRLLDVLCATEAALGSAELAAKDIEAVHYYEQAKMLIEAALDALDEAAIADGIISRRKAKYD